MENAIKRPLLCVQSFYFKITAHVRKKPTEFIDKKVETEGFLIKLTRVSIM